MAIPVLVYGDAFQWAKYGHHILPSNLELTSHPKTGIHQKLWNYLIEFLRTDLDRNQVPSSLDLTSHNKAGLHQTFQKSLVEFLCTDFLIEFLCTDLEGNLSFTLNPLTASKLDHFLLTLPEGLSETANKDKEFDQHVWNEKRKHRLIDEIVDIALSETQIPLSIFTNLFHKRFEKHSMLESTLEMLQQFYIQMEIEPDDFHLFPGDSSLYTLQAERGFTAGAVLFDLGGNGAFWQKKGVTLRGLWISKKIEILHKLTVFDDGGDSNCRSSLLRRLASIQGPSLLIIEL